MQSPDITCRFTMFPFANLDPNNFGQMLEQKCCKYLSFCFFKIQRNLQLFLQLLSFSFFFFLFPFEMRFDRY
jgi:hypothetical protein